tara:strand:+ start:117 stop:269 length:153 start_codon:yes stop_codon:yes gene_type:complete
MSGDKAHYEQPIVFYSEYMTETKRVLIQLHEEEEEIVIEKPWRNGSPLRE